MERGPIHLRTLLSTNRRASKPVEHPKWQLQRKTGRAAGQATASYGNATSGNHLIYADFPPRPGVELVENPALTGTVGVRESSYTTRVGLTGLSMSFRPWNSRPDGPNEGQKFANELARKMGAPHIVFFPQLRWTDSGGKITTTQNTYS